MARFNVPYVDSPSNNPGRTQLQLGTDAAKKKLYFRTADSESNWGAWRTVDTEEWRYLGNNPIASTADDTVANWASMGQGWAWFSASGRLYGQPSTWGFLLSFCIYDDVWQLWKVQSTGDIYWRSGNASTVWNNNSWNRLANVADIPVTSVNGMTGAVSVISGVAPDATYTTTQCLEYARTHPNIMFTWAKWAAATYTPVQVSGSWVYTLYTTYTLSTQYTTFEAFNGSTGDLYRCDADGTWHSVSTPVRTLANLSADVAVPSSTWTTIGSITLQRPGLYFVKGFANFASNATGRRIAILSGASGTSGSTRYWNDTRPAVNGAATICEFSGFTALTGTGTITYYLRVWQNSGSSINVSQYSGIDAIRLTSI